MGFPSGQEDVNFMAGTTAHGRPVSFSYEGCATVPVKVGPFLTGLDEGLIRRFVSFVYEGSLAGTAEKKPLPFAREGRDVLFEWCFPSAFYLEKSSTTRISFTSIGISSRTGSRSRVPLNCSRFFSI